MKTVFIVEQSITTAFWGNDEPFHSSCIVGVFGTADGANAFIKACPTGHEDEDQEVSVTYNYNVQSWAIQNEF